MLQFRNNCVTYSEPEKRDISARAAVTREIEFAHLVRETVSCSS